MHKSTHSTNHILILILKHKRIRETRRRMIVFFVLRGLFFNYFCTVMYLVIKNKRSIMAICHETNIKKIRLMVQSVSQQVNYHCFRNRKQSMNMIKWCQELKFIDSFMSMK